MSDIPDTIKKVVGPYIKRAQELEKYQPVISYFAEMYAAQLILEGKYHLDSSEVASYTETLLNKIEQDKKQLSESSPKIAEVLEDEEKGFKLVLGFSNVIFNGAEKQLKEGNASKKTASDFKAASDFYELLKLWNTLYEKQQDEISQRSKYSKYHCAKILRALKEGKDPNEVTKDEEHGNNVTAEKAELPSPPDNRDLASPEVSSTAGSSKSVDLPNPPAEIEGDLNMPEAPVLIKGQKNSLGLPSTPEENVNASKGTKSSEKKSAVTSKPVTSKPTLPSKPTIPSKSVSPKPTVRPNRVISSNDTTSPQPIVNSHPTSKAEVEKIWKKEEIKTQAQKKARFAISALNYDDIPTAIKELEDAIRLLKH